ncbi:hypothetical protein GCM10022197_35400 [Microlunatus spumicola]|uniref:Uncharacterized protein n=1 Tax=Microlunatus spumicola TaxID=81499 RepID=A0ABP6Y0C9_9ACTN
MTATAFFPRRYAGVSRPLLLAVVVVTVLANAVALAADLSRGTFLNVYNATQYYLTWQDGFFRRGFPGTVLHLLMGRDPTLAELSVVTAVATVLGLAAMLALVVVAARLPAFSGAEGVALTVLVASPLTFSMVLHNRSRLDPVVVLLVVALALLPERVLSSRWLSAVLAAGLAAAAVGSLEFAVGFVVALLIARALRQPPGAGRVVRFALELAPGLAIALASLLLRPSPATIDRVAARFGQVGVTAPRENSVSVLTNTVPQALDLNRDHLLLTRVLWFAVFAACFAVTVVLLRRLGRTGAFDTRTALACLVCCAATAGLVSIVGFDYGRWFSLALVGLMGSLVVGQRRPTTSVRVLGRSGRAYPRPTELLLLVVLLVSLVGQQFPVYPAWG